MRLSDRLENILELVPKGKVCADIGCDHGFTSIELISRGISPEVYASDLRPGPLERARENIRKAGLEDRIKIFLSDGFESYEAGSVQTAVIAGMGGMLMKDILTKGMDCIEKMDEFVVQPQSNIPEFRVFLRLSGFEIIRNNVILDSGKYYFPMKIRYTGKECTDRSEEITAADRYGFDLITQDRGLSDYLDFEYSSYEKILAGLISEKGMHDERTEEMKSLMELNREIRSQLAKD